MSTRARKRRPGAAPLPPSSNASQAVGGYQPLARPVWHWRTFPVFMAFAVGGFLGLYMGLLAYATGGDSVYTMAAFVFWALLLGFGLSRFVSTWMVSRGWSRARSVRRK